MINRVRLVLIIALVTCFFPNRAPAANPSLDDQWLHNASGYKRALELQRELKVPLIVYFYTDWCPFCHQLDRDYLPNAAVDAYLRGVVKVRINPEDGPDERAIADRYDVQGYPRFYVIRNSSSAPRNLQPFRRGGVSLTPEQFASVLQQAAPSSGQNVRSGNSQVVNAPGRAARGNTKVASTSRTAMVADAKLPSLDSVLQKYVEALGGKEALTKLTTRVIKGKVDVVGVSRGGQMEAYQKAPNKSLTVLDVHPLGVIKQGFDGSAGWFFSNKGTRTLKGPELTALIADSDFYRDLRFRELYPEARLLGKTKSGFRELYLVEAVPRGGSPEDLYFDVETGLLFRRDMMRQTSAGLVRAEIYYGDWREVDGIRLPFSITQSMGQVTLGFTIEEVKHNVTVDESVFRRP